MIDRECRPGWATTSDPSQAMELEPERRLRLRQLPSVNDMVAKLREHESTFADGVLVNLVRGLLEQEREAIFSGAPKKDSDITDRILRAVLALERPRLRPVINATGVIIHTNLGRAPVSHATAEAMRAAAMSAVALELEPETNERGGRMREVSTLLRALTGAEASLIVNNGAAAILLVLSAIAAGRDVIVSRGEAIEIGGGFRIPDVMNQSGSDLVEVGTTNRTYASDFAAATTERTGAYLKVHASNFRILGFVHSVRTDELADLGRVRGIPVIEDLGSGALLDTARFGLAAEPTIAETIAAGADLVTASGDKLLGGPQAGLVLGKRHLIEAVSRHPLARAIRADKTCLAGMAETLRHYARGEATEEIPVWRMISADPGALRRRAERVVGLLQAAGCNGHVAETVATTGGGALPGETMPSWAVVLDPGDGANVDDLARRMRTGDHSIFPRIDHQHLVCDLRTVLPEDDDRLFEGILHAAACNG